MASTTGEPSDNFYGDENIDEKITAQEQDIEKQIAMEQPLDLCNRFKSIRKTRGDGNCFFRAFGFCLFETLNGNKELVESIKKKATECSQNLINLGYNSFTIEDFRDVFTDHLDRFNEKISTEEIEQIFNDSGSSDYIVVFLRLIVSGYLQQNSVFYESFIEGYPTIKDFCSHEVEPMYRESDHIHIIALTTALEFPVSIIYLDRTDQDTATPHNFPEDSKPTSFILYRPGHYDIIYQ